MAAERQVYFVGAFLPNEGESDQTVEYAVLEWELRSEDDVPGNESTRPHLYVHSFLAPRLPGRVRWGLVQEHGIEPSYIRKRLDTLPSIRDMIDEDYLRGRHAVIFDRSHDPMRSVVQNASSVEEISALWAEVFKNSDDEHARAVSTLSEMLEYLGYPRVTDVAGKSAHYTPLLLELFATAAVWSVLKDLKSHPKKIKSLQGTLPFSRIWPLDEAPELPFEGDHATLSSFSPREIDNFFSRDMQDYVDWRRVNIYVNDWEYQRPNHDAAMYRSLGGAVELAEYVFTTLFDLKMQMWALIFYSVFEHKEQYAREVAYSDGKFGSMQQSVKSDFTSFVLGHLQDFLRPDQKQWLLSSLIRHFIDTRDHLPFEEYDFEELSRAQAKGESRFYFRQEPSRSSIKCFSEIATLDRMVKYRRYEISGHGDERDQTIRWVNELFQNFMEEVKNPFSNFWSEPETHRWCQILTGVEWQEICRPPRINEDPRVQSVRALIQQVIANASRPYIQKLRERLTRDIVAINEHPLEEFRDRFSFMGVSVEIVMCHRSQTSFLKRMLKL